MKLDAELKAYLGKLDGHLIKSAAVLTTAASGNKPGIIADILKGKGIDVCNESLGVRFGFRIHGLLGGRGNVTLTNNAKTVDGFV